MYRIIRHPVLDGWTYRFDKWWETEWAIKRRDAFPGALGVMVYLVKEIGVPWKQIVWPFGEKEAQ